ncbi:hypothetical protein Tco_1056903 [Tanacetum coccineum]|uniref:Uncharacterized protein n=1 Tax=Tanacetum coccineum TaxID=301880 RepID=A0ABQ5H416_9ASTR
MKCLGKSKLVRVLVRKSTSLVGAVRRPGMDSYDTGGTTSLSQHSIRSLSRTENNKILCQLHSGRWQNFLLFRNGPELTSPMSKKIVLNQKVLLRVYDILALSASAKAFSSKAGVLRIPQTHVWICQISQEISQKRTRERMSDQEAKDLKSRSQRNHASAFYNIDSYWKWMAMSSMRFRAVGQLIGASGICLAYLIVSVSIKFALLVLVSYSVSP